MSVTAPPPAPFDEVLVDRQEGLPEESPAAAGPPAALGGDEGAAPPTLQRTALAAFLVSAAAAVMVGGVFDSAAARPLALAAAAAGVGWTVWTLRFVRGEALRYLFAVVALLGASLAALAGGSRLSPIDAVATALSNGGLLQPPVPFEPGWRFIIVLLVALLSTGTTALVASGRRPRLGLMLPLPVVVGGALIQPGGAAVVDAVISLVLLVGGLMVLVSAEQAGGEGATRAFELRRLGRGAATLTGATVALVILNQTNFLFPTTQSQRTVPPQKPQVIPLSQVHDQVLFTARCSGTSVGPYRLGTLDVYDGANFLLPGYDPARLQAVTGPVERFRGGVQTCSFTVQGLDSRQLPDVANTETITQNGETLLWDPRTQTFSDRQTPSPGYAYSITAAVSPSGDQLAAAPAPQGDLAIDMQSPPPPAAVEHLLQSSGDNPYERLQTLRQHLFDNVVAAGPGTPVPVSSNDVVSMLQGGRASPYQIAAAQVLLARWAGVPARLGYGFYGGERQRDGSFTLRPRDGANWLEAYFQGFGWVPLIGQPRHAVSQLNSNASNPITAVPAQQVTLQLYRFVDISGVLQLYEIVRYWLSLAVPLVIALGLAVMFFPWPLKAWRRRRRRKWGTASGDITLQIATAYAELRDLAADLRTGASSDTPLEFVERFVPDAEHAELAWLVTRALWGDLRRDLQATDATTAWELSDSVTRRLLRAQNAVTRILSHSSRASLRAPFEPRIPNLWPEGRGVVALGRRLVRPRLAWPRLRFRRVVEAAP
ncbi:MAG: DUF3488 and transglutaminase-like domain-containing protein [Candidatus Dormibacteria bacterium]